MLLKCTNVTLKSVTAFSNVYSNRPKQHIFNKLKRFHHKAFSKNYCKTSYGKLHNDFDIVNLVSCSKVKFPNGISLKPSGELILEGKLLSTLKQPLDSLLQKLKIEKLHTKTFDKYGVTTDEDETSLFLPLRNLCGHLVAVQQVNLNTNGDRLSNILPGIEEFLLFGHIDTTSIQNQIIVASDPLDAMAINQVTDIPAVSVLFQNKSFPTQFFNKLKNFQKIILWLSNEHHNWKIHKLFVDNLDKRVFFIRSKHRICPLEGLQNGHNLKCILPEIVALKPTGVETFGTFKEDVYDEVCNYEKFSGIKWKRYCILNELLKGHRSGELTIFSGQTGTGKTTFMSEYSLDLCMQDLPTLWGSFEVSNNRLIGTMLTQFSLCSPRHNKEKFSYFASKFNELPMFFMNFKGDHTLKHVIEAMSNSVDAYSIQHVVVDNLQFMMNIDDLSSGIDLLRRQDQIFGAFRKFATQHNCHVTLVMHPRKEPEFTELNNTSISGSAKAIQEADNIIILQTTKTRQYLQVTKNRFDGEKGCVLLEFNKENLTFNIRKVIGSPKV